MAQEILDVLVQARQRGQAYAVATVIETKGSASAKTGSKAVIDHDGWVIAGWIGGGCAESITCEEALMNIQSGQTSVIDIDLNDEKLGVGMPCGGSMRVFVEPILPKPKLWIVGHGRIAECLCQIGDLMGLTVIVNDPEVAHGHFPAAESLITDDIDFQQLKPSTGDYVVIATQHKGDHESMQRALQAGAGYIALIASQKRARLVLDYLRTEGFNDADLQRVIAPAGLDLGAQSPEEIALSIIAEIVLLRRNGSGMSMHDKCFSQTLSSTREQVDNLPIITQS